MYIPSRDRPCPGLNCRVRFALLSLYVFTQHITMATTNAMAIKPPTIPATISTLVDILEKNINIKLF